MAEIIPRSINQLGQWLFEVFLHYAVTLLYGARRTRE